MNRWILAILASLSILMVAHAQTKPKLDPGAFQPYLWRVAVKLTPHPTLTADARANLLRELQASLQAKLEAAGRAEVVEFAKLDETENPFLKVFAERSWSAFEPDLMREIREFKTHILTVEHRGGQFHLTARQLDGPTGIASPLTRRNSTSDPKMLARFAAMLIEPDFGPIGLVEQLPNEPEKATITFQAHGLHNPDRWVFLGDVFAVSVVRELTRPFDPAKLGTLPKMRTAVPYAYTLLKVISRIENGQCQCQILTRFQDPFGRDALNRDARNRLGIRAMKLTTVEANVRLRLVGQDGLPHQRSSLLQVAGTDRDFDAIPGADDVFKLESGIYRSSRVFTNIACVQVGLEGDHRERFPVPVLGGEPVLLKFEVKPADEERAIFAQECNRWRIRVAELAATQEAMFTGVNRLLDSSKNIDAMKQAESGSNRIGDDRKLRGDELAQLKTNHLATDERIKLVLETGEKQLKAIDDGQDRIGKTLVMLREVAAKSNDPEKLELKFRVQELAERINLLISRGEIPEALEAYDKLIKLVPDEQDYKDKREKLLAEWTPKDEEHRKARETIKTWATTRTIEEFQDRHPNVFKALNTHIAREDRLGLLKFTQTFEPLSLRLSKIIEEVDAGTDDGQKTLKSVDTIREHMKNWLDLTNRALARFGKKN